MGWCHEFGVVVCEGCSAPMVAGESACSCPECGTTCPGRFASCPDVWAAGPRPVSVRAPVEVRPAERPPATLVASLLADEPTAAAPAPAPAAPSSRAVGEVLAWMVGALDDLRSELQSVGETVAAQHAAAAPRSPASAAGEREPLLVAELRDWIAAQADRDAALADAVATLPGRLADELAARSGGETADATARIVSLAENLPSRLGVAIAAAIEGRQDAYLDRVERVTTGLETALADVRATMTELRTDLERSHRTAAVEADRAVERVGAELGRRLDQLSTRVDRLAGSGAVPASGQPG